MPIAGRRRRVSPERRPRPERSRQRDIPGLALRPAQVGQGDPCGVVGVPVELYDDKGLVRVVSDDGLVRWCVPAERQHFFGQIAENLAALGAPVAGGRVQRKIDLEGTAGPQLDMVVSAEEGLEPVAGGPPSPGCVEGLRHDDSLFDTSVCELHDRTASICTLPNKRDRLISSPPNELLQGIHHILKQLVVFSTTFPAVVAQ